MLSARLRGGIAEFILRRRTTAWQEPTLLATGPTAGYIEVGQALGLAAAGDRVAIAVPVNGPVGSQLVVSVHQFPTKAPVLPSRDATQSRPATARQAASWTRWLAIGAPIGGALAALAAVLALVRRGRVQRRTS